MTKMCKPLKIGDVTIKTPVILAPMAGVTDLPYRVLCAGQGAGMCCMEMISAKAILYNSKKTEALMSIDEREGIVSLQLFGSDPDIMGEIAKRIEDRPFHILDINMGCPVPKVVNNGEGSALMRDPVLAGRIVEACAKAIKKPVTVKIRKGFDEGSVNAPELCHIIEESGGAAVTVHGRTREQMYSGRADWDVIARCAERVSIPVIGNGDVTDGPSALSMLEETGAAAVAVGRAAQGNPWIFREIKAYLEGLEVPERPGLSQVKEMILTHAAMLADFKGEYIAVREMRKHTAWYLAGFRNAASLRREVCHVETMESFEDLIGSL